MTMFNPPHAGMLITDVIETKGITALELSSAMKLQDWLLSVATIAKEKQEELPQPSQAKN